jgi:hypothetical protein
MALRGRVADDVRRDESLRGAHAPVACLAVVLALLTVACTRQRPGQGVAQLPVDETSSSTSIDGRELAWQVSFINSQPLSYPRDARNTFVTGRDFTAELKFSEDVDEELFEQALQRGVKPAGGDPVITWESPHVVLFDVRGCSGHVRIDFLPLAREAGLARAAPLVIDCGPSQRVNAWSADRGTEVIGNVLSHLEPSSTLADRSAVFHHRMRNADGGSDIGVWLADFHDRTLKTLGVHYLGVEVRTGFLDGDSLLVSTGGDDLQLFGSNGVRVRQFDPQDLGLVVGLEIDALRDRIAIFEGKMDDSGRSGETRLRILDRNLFETSRIAETGRLSRLSGQWRTVDAAWLDHDTIAYIHWDNRFYGVVAVADITARTVTRTTVVADKLAGALADGRFVVRRQTGGRAGCWRVESADGASVTPLCERLPGPVRAAVSPDGNLVALELYDGREIVVWNRVSGERRRIGEGSLAGWTPAGELVWVSEQETLSSPDEDLM